MGANGPMLTAAGIRALATHRGEPVVTSVYLDVDGRTRPVADDYRAAFARLAGNLRHRVRTVGDRRTRACGQRRHRPHARLARAGTSTARRPAGWRCSRPASRTGSRRSSCPDRSTTTPGSGPRPGRPAAGRAGRVRAGGGRARRPPATPGAARRTRRAGRDRRSRRLGGPRRRHHGRARRLPTPHRRPHPPHYERAARLVEHAIADWPGARLVVAGPDRAVAGFEDHLRPETRQRIVGRAGLSLAAGTREIHDAIATIARAAGRRHKTEIVEQLRQAAARSERRGVVGLEATLAALAEERVGALVVSEGFSAPGARCPACGRTGIAVRRCPRAAPPPPRSTMSSRTPSARRSPRAPPWRSPRRRARPLRPHRRAHPLLRTTYLQGARWVRA